MKQPFSLYSSPCCGFCSIVFSQLQILVGMRCCQFMSIFFMTLQSERWATRVIPGGDCWICSVSEWSLRRARRISGERGRGDNTNWATWVHTLGVHGWLQMPQCHDTVPSNPQSWHDAIWCAMCRCPSPSWNPKMFRMVWTRSEWDNLWSLIVCSLCLANNMTRSIYCEDRLSIYVWYI